MDGQLETRPGSKDSATGFLAGVVHPEHKGATLKRFCPDLHFLSPSGVPWLPPKFLDWSLTAGEGENEKSLCEISSRNSPGGDGPWSGCIKVKCRSAYPARELTWSVPGEVQVAGRT